MEFTIISMKNKQSITTSKVVKKSQNTESENATLYGITVAVYIRRIANKVFQSFLKNASGLIKYHGTLEYLLSLLFLCS